MAKRNNSGNGGTPATPCIDLYGPDMSHQEVYHNPPAWLPEIFPVHLTLAYQSIPGRVHVPRV